VGEVERHTRRGHVEIDPSVARSHYPLTTPHVPFHGEHVHVLILGVEGHIRREKVFQTGNALGSKRIGHIIHAAGDRSIIHIHLGIHPATTRTDIRLQAPIGEILAFHQGETPDHVEHHSSGPQFYLIAGVEPQRGTCAHGVVTGEVRTKNIEDIELESEERQRFQEVAEFAADHP
jgi:hypothetical protein